MDTSSSQWSTQSPEQSCELYIRDYPHRSIAIVSTTHALILRYSSAATEFNASGSHISLPSTRSRGHGDVAAAKCMVEFSPLSQELLKDYRPLISRPVYGTLGLISINGEVFLSIINHAARAATVRPGETVERILSVSFYCLSSADYDDVVPLDSLDSDYSDASSVHSRDGPYAQGLGRRDIATEHHPCHDLRKILSNGSFYYSTDFDVTTRLQERPVNSNSFQIDDFDDTYLWNSYMISPLVRFRSRLMPQEQAALDKSRILTSAIRGFCKTMTIPQSGSPLKDNNTGRASLLTLISRLSCRRAGTRFNARGIDDDGHVANFVESETVFWSPSGTVFSYAQVRGSIPVFWEQATDLLPGRQKITLTRSPDATQPTFNKHFEDLEKEYGAVHIINLLSNTKPGEVELGSAYKIGLHNCPLSQPSRGGSADNVLLRETHYDFHAETKGPAGYEAARDIRRYIEHSTDGFAYFLAEEADDGSRQEHKGAVSRLIVVLQQEGVFRTNCLDCLDRTNLIQTMISQMAMETFLEHRAARASSDFWMRHSTLWADNGDSLSKIYAGTGALKSSFTRHGKMSLAGAVADMRKSVQRIYHNNFVDPSRQLTIDMLLGRLIDQAPVDLFDPISDYVSAELNKRSDEFTKVESISIWAGTFNLNGKTEGLNHDLSPWLFPPAIKAQLPDIYVVAFQEIVELSPQQIMNSDPSRKYLWEQAVQRTLNQRQSDLGDEHYVLLRSGQLVGAALCIFVKASALPSIKNVEGSVKKTGLSGMAGNKGAVAIRLDYANTQICFVTAHLAAGFGNYDERNRDYTTIHEGLRFQRDRGIDNHDTVIWLGDFNYRIGLGADTAKAMIKNGDLGGLYENDQLNLQMVAGLAFKRYSESRITFMPTYKFDVGTDTYDTSEKARIPAWTDRILRKGTNLRQLAYDSAPLRFSDHRPVYATFDCDVSIVDHDRRETISQELYLKRKHDIGDTTAHIGDGNATDDEDLIGYDAVEPGLPPASSDRHKWWLDNGQPARAQVASANGHTTILNPGRPSNPFGKTSEPDWVNISRGSPASTASGTSYAQSTRSKGMVSANNSRRLPPVYDLTSLPANVGPMKTASDGIQRKAVPDNTEPPPPPPPRRSGTASSQIMTAQPLPYRPGSASSQASSQSQQTKDGKGPPPIARKPAYLSTSAANSPVAAVPPSQGLADANGSAPTLPRRPIANQANVDLLGGLDESGAEMGGWQSLQPSTK